MPDYDPNASEHQSWVPVDPESDFPIQNLPFGIFEKPGRGVRPGVRIGDTVLDLAELKLAEGNTLNGLASCAREIRRRVSWLLNAANSELRDDAALQSRSLLPIAAVETRLPFGIGDYIDFYSSLEHATNVGKMFRDPANPLLPNWRHLPVGYHGKAGTVILGDRDIRRPHGQLSKDNQTSVVGPSRRLDFELEVGFFLNRSTALGESIPVASAEEAIFGLVLLNDWSARDIQRWEYQPLGPFLSKSFATSITPWVIPLDALAPFRVAGPAQDPPVLPYLQQQGARNLNIELEVWLQPLGETAPMCICRTNFSGMYWSVAQQVAHLTSNGASVRTGDLCGSGTISGSEPDSFGSLLELTWNGARPIHYPGGAERTFLEDGDRVIIKGACVGAHRIGFGDLSARVLPA
jgi:fumarylacetoacetase